MNFEHNLAPDSLRELIAAHLRSQPHAPALLSRQELPLSYAALNARIDRVGRVLRAENVARRLYRQPKSECGRLE